MTLGLIEGQDFSAHYTLLQRISQGNACENWLALDKSSSERVALKIFPAPLDDADLARVQVAIKSARGLVHPHIARALGVERAGGMDAIVSQYISGAKSFVPSQEHFTGQWPIVAQLFETLAYAHQSGVAHGHLHPSNLLLDQHGQLVITDFGLPAGLSGDGTQSDWASPQVRQGQPADRSDDIYSVGCLLYLGLTGRQWREDDGFRTDSPIPDEVRQLVSSMLASAAYERPQDLSHVETVTRRYLLGEADVPLEDFGGFSRAVPRPGTGTSSPVTRRESHVMSAPAAFAGFAALLVIAGIVFFLLPSVSTDRPEAPANLPVTASDSSAANPEAPPAQTPLEIAKRKQLQKEGNDVATRLLQLQAALENVGVQLWAPDKYKQVQELSNKGDEAYRKSEFQQALDLYKQGVATLEDLQSQVPTIEQDNLDTGSRALDAGDYETAIKSYTIVTAIDPKNAAANHDLERAENLQEVLALIKDGNFEENEGKLDVARDKFIAASKLDPEWKPAREAVNRVDALIAKRRFDDAMSVAFTALGNHDYARAKTAFQRAQKILPHSTEPADGLQQVAIAIRQDKIDAHRKAALEAIDKEAWPEAIKEYETILKLDPTLVFANQGLAGAKARQRLDSAMNRFISNPALLAADNELAAAKRLLVTAANENPAGPKLQAQMDSLSQLISVARIPISVQLNSDNLTDVTVYRVGHLGRLESTSLQLVPGQYTIIGHRQGYRDVQKTLTVIGGQPHEPVYISCTERI